MVSSERSKARRSSVALDHGEADAVHRDRGADRAVVGDDVAGHDEAVRRRARARDPSSSTMPGEHRPPPSGRRPTASDRERSESKRVARSGRSPCPDSTVGRARLHRPAAARGTARSGRPHRRAPRSTRASAPPSISSALHVALAELLDERSRARRAPSASRSSTTTSAPASRPVARRGRRARGRWWRRASARRRRTAAASAAPALRSRRRPAAADAPCRRTGPRTVSAGSSAIAVPAPTTIASDQARRRCTSARAASPVIHRRRAVARRRLPVEARRHLQHDERRPVRDVVLERDVQRPRLVARAPRSRPRCRPRAARRRRGRRRPGSGRSPPRRRARRRPRSGRSVQGGVRPKWSQGSRVQTTVAPRARVARLRAAPRPRRAARPRALVPALADDVVVADARPRPTSGLGETRPQPRSRELEGPPHVRLVRSMPSCLLRPGRVGTAGARRSGRARRHGRAVCPSPPIPTVTVGSGIAPDPPTAGGRGVADSHRRWGVAPRPGNELLQPSIRTPARAERRRGSRASGGPVRSMRWSIA